MPPVGMNRRRVLGESAPEKSCSVFTPPSASAGKNLSVRRPRVRTQAHFAGACHTGDEGQSGGFGGGEDGFIESGSQSERGPGIAGAAHLVRGEQGARPDMDFREPLGDSADGFFGGIRAEGDFHDVQAGFEQGFGQGRGLIHAVQDNDGNEAFFGKLGGHDGWELVR